MLSVFNMLVFFQYVRVLVLYSNNSVEFLDTLCSIKFVGSLYKTFLSDTYVHLFKWN